MNQHSEPLKSLILDILQLCERTRSLADSGEQSARALGPVRESLETIRRAADSLAACWELESLSPALPSLDAIDGGHEVEVEASDDWLFGESAAG